MSLGRRLRGRWTAWSIRAQRGPWLREFVGFGGSTVADQAMRLLANLVVAAIVGPVAWGTWYLLNLALQYGSLLHLGALNGMQREVAAAIGRGDEEAAVGLRRTAVGFVLLVYGVALAVLLGVLVPLGLVAATPRLGLMVALLISQQAFAMAFTHMKARTDFRAASRLQFASSLTYPLAAVGGAYLSGLDGFLAGLVATYVLLGIGAATATPGLFAPLFDVGASLRLLRIGFPIMLVGISYTLFATVDRWVIQGAMGAEALGHYALAIMALGAVGLLPSVVVQQVYPRMAMAWARDRRWSALEPLVARQRWSALAIALPAAAVTAVVAPWGIRTFLPGYEPAIPALLVSMTIPLISVVGQGYGNAFNVVGLQGWYLAAILLAAATNLAVSLSLVGTLGLVGVAIGTAAGFAALAAALLVAGRRARRHRFQGSNGPAATDPPRV
jgi:O-antigen/teichoic acid export membrane protein